MRTEANTGSAAGRREKANRLTTWFSVGGRYAFPGGRRSLAQAEVRAFVLAGEMRTAESTETQHNSGKTGRSAKAGFDDDGEGAEVG